MQLQYPFLDAISWASPIHSVLLFGSLLMLAVLFVSAGLSLMASLNSTLAALHSDDTPAR